MDGNGRNTMEGNVLPSGVFRNNLNKGSGISKKGRAYSVKSVFKNELQERSGMAREGILALPLNPLLSLQNGVKKRIRCIFLSPPH